LTAVRWQVSGRDTKDRTVCLLFFEQNRVSYVPIRRLCNASEKNYRAIKADISGLFADRGGVWRNA